MYFMLIPSKKENFPKGNKRIFTLYIGTTTVSIKYTDLRENRTANGRFLYWKWVCHSKFKQMKLKSFLSALLLLGLAGNLYSQQASDQSTKVVLVTAANFSPGTHMAAKGKTSS